MKQPRTTRIPQLNASQLSRFNEIIATLWLQQTPAQKPEIAPWLSADRSRAVLTILPIYQSDRQVLAHKIFQTHVAHRQDVSRFYRANSLMNRTDLSNAWRIALVHRTIGARRGRAARGRPHQI